MRRPGPLRKRAGGRQLEPGDLALVPHGEWHRLSSKPGRSRGASTIFRTSA